MRNFLKVLPAICLLAFFSLQACSGTNAIQSSDLDNIDLFLDADPSPSVSISDADGDGIYTSCDVDDNDASVIEIKDECDDPDFDGYVNTACNEVADTDSDGIISEVERSVIGFNCDVCPQDFDPDQTDSNNDGVGDACSEAEDIYDDTDGYDDEEDPYDNEEDDDEEDDDEEEDEEDQYDDEDPVLNSDRDGDGLANDIDPEPNTFNNWGLINKNDPELIIGLADHLNDYAYLRSDETMDLPGADLAGAGHTLPTVASGGFKSVNADSIFKNDDSVLKKVVEYGIYIDVASSGPQVAGRANGI